MKIKRFFIDGENKSQGQLQMIEVENQMKQGWILIDQKNYGGWCYPEIKPCSILYMQKF